MSYWYKKLDDNFNWVDNILKLEVFMGVNGYIVKMIFISKLSICLWVFFVWVFIIEVS